MCPWVNNIMLRWVPGALPDRLKLVCWQPFFYHTKRWRPPIQDLPLSALFPQLNTSSAGGTTGPQETSPFTDSKQNALQTKRASIFWEFSSLTSLSSFLCLLPTLVWITDTAAWPTPMERFQETPLSRPSIKTTVITVVIFLIVRFVYFLKSLIFFSVCQALAANGAQFLNIPFAPAAYTLDESACSLNLNRKGRKDTTTLARFNVLIFSCRNNGFFGVNVLVV